MSAVYSRMDTYELLVEFEDTVRKSATWDKDGNDELEKLQALRDEVRFRLGI